MEDEMVCTVVTSLTPMDDWYPTCGKPAVGLMPVLELPWCEEHKELFKKEDRDICFNCGYKCEGTC